MMRRAGLYFMALLYLVAGINHFVMPEFYLRIMPPYIPEHHLMVILSGVAEIVLGLMLVVPQCTRIAAWGIIVLLIAIFPANLHMALHYEDFAISPWIGYGRLPLQLVLLYWAWRYTRPAAASPE